MALEDTLRSLREFDVNDIDFDNIGSWPTAVKAVLCVLLLVVLSIGSLLDLFLLAPRIL